MPRLLTLFALTLALGLSAEQATAVGFGKASVGTVLGQPLVFTIALRLDPGESVDAKCVKAEVSFGDHTLPDAMVRARVETQAATGERRIRVSTAPPVDEPVVAIQVQVGCPPTLSRSFTVLADPPAQLAVSDTSDEGWSSGRDESAVAPILAAVPPADPNGGKAPDRTGVASSARAAQPEARAASRPRAAAVKPGRGPVLRLDPVEAESDTSANPALPTGSSTGREPESAASAALSPASDAAQHQQEQERLKAVEAALLKLRSDNQATHEALAEMRLRLRTAEASRYANPLVYLLVTLCVLLAAGLAVMWRLRQRDRAVAALWAAQAAAEIAPTPTTAEEVATAPSAKATAPGAMQGAMPEFPPAPLAPQPPPPAPFAFGPSEPAALVPEPRRPMSAEELIDLEQQAEFFVVLGQDEAAIDLLMGHVRSTGGVSPLPYLKLLEIYRRRGEREPYDRIRERFNRRFNAYAPEWDVDPERGLDLQGYPEVMSRLQNAWESPSRAMDLLDSALFRRDAGPTFDVPAYRELLFLYGMARDLAERDVSPGDVDLLLPLGDELPSTMTSVPASSPTPAPAGEIGGFSLDLDVSSDPPPRLSLDDDTGFKRSGR